MSPKTKISMVLVIGLLVVACWYFFAKQRSTEAPTKNEATSFNKMANSIDDPSSIWVIVNKKRPISSTYVPKNLRVPSVTLRLNATAPEMQLTGDAAKATEQLFAAAKAAGVNLMVVSGYRSYDSQKTVYNSYVKQDGQAAADTYSARPGHSEHQTGLAVDFGTTDRTCELEICFGETKAGKWLEQNAQQYGFTLRYAKNNESKVGYQYEPWHFRYVGTELAQEIAKTNQTLEEFFGLPLASSY